MTKKLVQNESRNRIRHELIYYLKVTDRQTGLEFGRLGDIHLEGLLLFTQEPLSEQAVYELTLELPKTLAISEGYSELPFQAQVLWNRPGSTLCNYYYNGLRFLDLDNKAKKVIRLLTEIFAMRGRDPKPQNVFTN